ncbi:MAG: hypothetical protein JO057_14215 [Chloroflexi bacterium]|nr:hypothetical protein [Chloroflexota bacterium]
MHSPSLPRWISASMAATTFVALLLGTSVVALKPQPLPPGVDAISLNPQPLPPLRTPTYS